MLLVTFNLGLVVGIIIMICLGFKLGSWHANRGRGRPEVAPANSRNQQPEEEEEEPKEAEPTTGGTKTHQRPAFLSSIIYVAGKKGTVYHTRNNCTGLNLADTSTVTTLPLCAHCKKYESKQA